MKYIVITALLCSCGSLKLNTTSRHTYRVQEVKEKTKEKNDRVKKVTKNHVVDHIIGTENGIDIDTKPVE
jgi:hypothetical protein